MKCFDAEPLRHRVKIKTEKIKVVIKISSSLLRRQEPSDFEVVAQHQPLDSAYAGMTNKNSAYKNYFNKIPNRTFRNIKTNPYLLA